MVLINFIKNIPLEVNLSMNFYLEYCIFEQKQRIKIEFTALSQKGNEYYVILNKLKVFYFFALERKYINLFLKEQKVFYYF